MWLADFPCPLCAAHGRLWHESRGLSAHREGEFLPREWEMHKLTFPVCVCSHSYHCICPGWWDDLGGRKTSLIPSIDVVCTDKVPSFHPLGFMCFLILVSSISWVFFSLMLPSSVNVKDLISATQTQEFVWKNPVCCDVCQTEWNVGTKGWVRYLPPFLSIQYDKCLIFHSLAILRLNVIPCA